MILVVSHADDDHAGAVLAELDRLAVPAVLFDVASFPQHAAVVLRYGDPTGASLRLRDQHGRTIDLGAVSTVWWRRARSIELDPDVPAEEAPFTYNECVEALHGLWTTVDAFWVNEPARDRAAAYKAHQLRVAEDVGLRIPRTAITNDPDEARAFIAERRPQPTAYKCFSATPEQWRETRLLRPDELALLERVQVAPVIFQEYVPAQADLRVTIVGDHCFAAAIRSRHDAYPVDFRMDLSSAQVEPTTLPAQVEQRLRALLERLGLVYGAVDLRLTPQGEHVFLEVNTAGQWRFVEQRTRQPITAAVARTLAEGTTAVRAGATAVHGS